MTVKVERPEHGARTYDLDVDKVDRMILGGDNEELGVQLMCCLPWCEVLLWERLPRCGRARRPDLSGSADEVRRHDEDGVPARGLGEVRPLNLFGTSTRMGGDSAS